MKIIILDAGIIGVSTAWSCNNWSANIPYIGKTRVGKLWVNAGHGTLGWTHGAGSGKALAELIGGRQPDMAFGFHGVAPARPRALEAVAVGG